MSSSKKRSRLTQKTTVSIWLIVIVNGNIRFHYLVLHCSISKYQIDATKRTRAFFSFSFHFGCFDYVARKTKHRRSERNRVKWWTERRRLKSDRRTPHSLTLAEHRAKKPVEVSQIGTSIVPHFVCVVCVVWQWPVKYYIRASNWSGKWF